MNKRISISIVSAILFWSILPGSSSCKSKEQKAAEDYMNKINETVNENSPSNAEAKES